MTQQEQAFLQAYTTLSKRNDLYAQQKRAYQNLNQNDFDSAYNAALLKQSPIRANTQKYGIAADLANWGYDNLVANNSFGAGVADTTATWLAGGARLLGYNDFADRADALKRYHRVYHDMYNGDSTLSNLAYGVGTIAPELPIGGPAIKVGTGILSNALKSAGFGGLMGGITSLADSDQSLGQAGMSAVYGGVGGGLLGAVGSSVLGKMSGYGWGNSGGLLDRGITNSGGLLDRARIKPDPITGTANAGDDAIARAMKAQMNPNATDDLGISEPKFYVPNGLKDPTLAAIDNDLAQELMQKLNDLKLRGQLTEQTTDTLLKEAFAKGERVAQPQMSVKPNFVMGESSEVMTDYNVPIAFEEWVKKAAGINPDKEIVANLYTLAKKHPEMFERPSDVYRLIREVKNNPQFFYRNNRPDIALMGKFLENGKMGKIGIVKDGEPYNVVAHTTTQNPRPSNYQDVVRTADPTLPLLPHNGGGQTPGANAHSHLDVQNPTTPNINAGLDDTQYSMQMSSSLRGNAEAINNVGSPTREIATHSVNARNDIGSVHNLTNNIATQAASNAVAGTAGGIANVVLDDSDDALALKFAKGFAYGVMGKVAAKYGMPAATKVGKAAFDYAIKQTTELRTLWRENPQLWTRFLNKQLTDDFAQFGGQKAGLHAERFAVAETLAAKGVGETEILERTGWFKGLDGNWKFQIDLSNGAAYKLREGTYSLVQLFKQPSLYQAYPFLKKMRVSIQTMPENVNGYFDMPTLTIHLNSANNKFDFTQALSHEVQHIIQQYEGFAVGTSKKDPNYWTNAGEVEARATFKGGENNPQQRLNNELEEGRIIQEFEKQAPQSSLRGNAEAINNVGSPNDIAHSQKLEDSYLNKATQRIDTEALNKHAIPLPKPLSQQEFMAQAQTDAQGIARVQTPIGEVNVHLEGAWRHINKGNTYGKDRSYSSGAFFDTLTDPLFVVKQKYIDRAKLSENARENANSKLVHPKDEGIIAQDSYIFFKPYLDSSGSKYLAAFTLDKNGKLINTTFYEPNASKIKQWIQSHDDDLLYYKFDPQSSLRGETEAINNANSPNGLGNETLVQQIQTKFKFDEAKARDLAQWHKDSHPVTKEKDGTPKVFYHGSGDDFGFEVFKPSAADAVEAIYFSTSEKVAKSYEQMGYRNSGIYKCFLNIKNPLVLDFKKEGYNSEKYAKALHQAKANGNDGVIIKNVYDDTGGYYDSKGDFKDIPSAHTYIIFDSKQIKEINNRGIEGKYFNESSPNIYESVRKPTTDNQHHTQKLDISGLTINLREMSAEQRKAFVAQLDLRANAEHVPAKMSEEEFRNSAVKYAKNKPNFLAHIKSRDDAEARMKLLNLVEPTIEHFHYKVVNGDVERFIKTFSYEGGKNDVFSLVVTKNNKTQLTTFLPTTDERYIRRVIAEGEQVVGGQRIASLTEGSKALSTKQGKTTDSQGISSDLLPDDTQYSLKNPLKDLRNAAARIEGIKAFAKYLANPPEHLKADAQRLRADKAAMAELDMHTRKAATDKANAIDELAYQMGYPEPQYSMKNPRQKQKFKEDSVGLVEKIRSSSKAFADKILHSKWVDVPLGTRIYTKGFEDYRGIKDSFDRDIAANTSAALDLHNKLKLLSEDNQRKMYQYMSGDLKGEELTKDIRELADEFRKVVRKETDELVRLGLLNEDTAKKWGDIYIMREYSPRVSERIKRALGGGRSEDYGIGLDSIHMRGKKEKVSVEKYNEMLENGEIGDITKGKWEVLHKPTKHEPKYILRRDYTKSEREKMGEIELISTALPRTLAKLQNQKRIATFFDALSKNSDLAFKLEKNQEIPSGFRQLRGEQFGAVKSFSCIARLR